jgi:hypothetical protein
LGYCLDRTGIRRFISVGFGRGLGLNWGKNAKKEQKGWQIKLHGVVLVDEWYE